MDRVREVIAAARDHGCSMRIGVNAGSLERDLLEKYAEPCPEALVESALRHIHVLEDNDFLDFKVSVKASDVFLAVAAYRGLAEVCDYPLHLGITEAGGLRTGTVKSAIGLGMLLWEGIGDTIRVSLAADPVEEVRAGFEILKALKLADYLDFPQLCWRAKEESIQRIIKELQKRDKVSIRPDEVFFVDDWPENVVPVREWGATSLLFGQDVHDFGELKEMLK